MKEQYFIQTRTYAGKNKAEKQLIEAVECLDQLLTDNVDKIENTLNAAAKKANEENKRCKDLVVVKSPHCNRFECNGVLYLMFYKVRGSL